MPFQQVLAIAIRQVLDPGDGLSGFLSRVSIAGLVLAIALLLAVMSVMNGFEREMRERILGFVPHVTVRGSAAADDWQGLLDSLPGAPDVVDMTPFFDADALAVRGRDAVAMRVIGLEGAMDDFSSVMSPMKNELVSGEVVLGAGLAASLNLSVGGRLTLIAPTQYRSDRPVVPRRFTVSGLIETGTELDHSLALASRADVAALAGSESPINGIALTVNDLFEAPKLRWYLDQNLPLRFYTTDWTASHGNLYAAIRLSRNLILLLMASIIAVAAFNVVSSLVLVVTDRAASIAMLRAVGTKPYDVVWVYLVQGGLIGGFGALGGCLLGAILTLFAPLAATWAGQLLGRSLLDTQIYPVGFLPVSMRLLDFALVSGTSILLCLVAAVLPAWRAARLPVASTLSR